MLKKLVRPLVPAPVISAWRRYAEARIDQRFARSTPAEVFSAVYRERLWGTTADRDYCSGTGSHEDAFVTPYVAGVTAFLAEFPELQAALDLGCGDFNIGAHLVNAFSSYVAVDVVPELIEHNARRFAHLRVQFQCRDIVADDLPRADVVFLRQVLQHLSNAQIAAVVPKLSRYPWLIVTEHFPAKPLFRPNVDKPIGPGVRQRFGSGVVLTAAPFNLPAVEARELCVVPCAAGNIHTVAYRIAPTQLP
jgi:hypothetical protein